MQKIGLFILAVMLPALAQAANTEFAYDGKTTPLITTSQTIGEQGITFGPDTDILVTDYTLHSGHKLPVHKHLYQRLVYVMSGASDLTDIESGKTTVFEEGTFIVETRDHWHSAKSVSKVPTHFLTIDFVPTGVTNNVVLHDGTSMPPKRTMTIHNATASGQPLHLPELAEIRSFLYTTGPKTNFPVHQHPYPRMLYIIEGEMDILDSESHEIRKLKQGDFMIESVNRWHWGENNGTTPVKMLVLDIVPKGYGNNIILKGPLH